MTMLSFRVNDDDAAAVELWARRLHIERSELLRAALRRHLSELASEVEARVTDSEKALGDIAEWGPAEDWSDWANAEG
jgi:predicted transcriptional regulator